MDGMLRTSTIRPMQPADFDEWIALAKAKYVQYYPRLDYHSTWEFLNRAYKSDDYLLLVGRNVCFCASHCRSFMEPEISVGGLWVFTRYPDLKEFVGVIRAMEGWARDLNAIECGFGNISDKDFTRVAQWLGYKKSAQYFSKRLR